MLSFNDEFLLSKPPVRRRGRDRPCGVGHRRQRGLRDYEPVEQVDVDVYFVLC